MVKSNTNNGNEMNLIDITDLTDAELDALLATPNTTDVTDMTNAEFSALIGDTDDVVCPGRLLEPSEDFDGLGWVSAKTLAARLNGVVSQVDIYNDRLASFQFRRTPAGRRAENRGYVAGEWHTVPRMSNGRGGWSFTDEDVIATASAKSTAWIFAV